jgi:hypothetical protein
MKKLILFLSLTLMVSFAIQAQVVSVEVEEYLVHPSTDYSDGVNLDGFTTYRVYATCQSADDFVSAFYGVQCEITKIWSTTSMWQSEFGGPLATDINPDLFQFAESMEWDTFVTIGMESVQDDGALFPATDAPPNNWMANYDPSGDPLLMSGLVGGALAATNGEPNGVAGDDFKVLLGQFTTDGCLNGFMYIQSFINGDGNDTDFGYFTFSTCDAVFGCIDPAADNYDSNATEDDFSCAYPCMLEIDQLTVNEPSCADLNDGTIEVAVVGEQCSVGYQMDGGNVLAIGSWSNLSNGEYVITVTDNAGCEVEETIVMATEAITLDVTASNISCNGAGDGMLEGTGSGGTGDLVFDLDDQFGDPSDMIDFMNLDGGVYTVYAMDINGCIEASNTVTVVEPGEVQIAVQNQSPATCFDTDDGVIVMAGFGGNGLIQYSIDGGDFMSSPLTSSGGDFEIVGMDESGCTDTVQVFIESPA